MKTPSPPSPLTRVNDFLKRLIQHPVTDLVVILLILTSLVVLVLQMIYERKDPQLGVLLERLTQLITLLFFVELSLRFSVERSKRRFFRRYWLDILALAPYFRAFRVLRIFMLLRIFRLGKLLGRHMRQMRFLLLEGIAEHLILLLVIVALVLGCAFLIEFVEGEVNPDFREFSQALRWSLFSLVAGEPVGGTPQTTIGWMIQFGVMLGGITVFAVFTGIVAAMMTQTLTYRMEDKMLDMEDLENHIVLCGWNRMAPIIIKELQADPSYRQCPIVVIAEFGEHEPDLSDPKIDETTIFVVKADYTTIEALEHARIERAQTAIILADKLKARSDQDRDARTVLAALTIEKLNKQIFTCIELLNRKNAAQLQMIGVEEIVVGDEYSANIFASASRNQGLVALVNEIFTPRYGNQFYKYDVPEGWYGRRVGEIFLPLKEQANALLTAVEICRENDGRIERSMKVNPPLDFTFTPCQKVVVMAKEEIDLTKVDPAGVKPT